jgi:hypothetical protein
LEAEKSRKSRKDKAKNKGDELLETDMKNPQEEHTPNSDGSSEKVKRLIILQKRIQT